MATLGVSPYPKMLYENVEINDFDKTIAMCRFVKDYALWACLAAMSLYCRELNTAEIALASIDEADKVQYINYIKELPSEPSRNAALAAYCKKPDEAENILLSNRLFYRAIKMNIKSYKWERALDIALQNKTHVDTVIAYRARYLEQMGLEEDKAIFQQYSQSVDIDWETIKGKIRADK